MNDLFPNIAILGRHDDPRVAEPMKRLTRHLTKAGINVIAADTLELDLPLTRMDAADLGDNADLAIAIGGDGTMLYAGRMMRESGTPVLGINRGRLGFLADVTTEEMIASVDLILRGNYTLDSRMLLEARLRGPSGEDRVAFALNDVVLQRRETGRMVDFSTRVGGHFVNTHSGDGLIIATPTGSTAYSLSCGGPIIEPQLNAIAIVPICPHTLTDRPIVIPGDEPVEVILLQREDTKAEVTVDGHSLGEIRPTDTLTISVAAQRISLVHPPGYDFYGILRSKLLWGHDNRKRND